MAYISFQPRDFFTNFQYSGDDSSHRAFTGFGYQPDLIYEVKRNGLLLSVIRKIN